jgi:hypothetical protein
VQPASIFAGNAANSTSADGRAGRSPRRAVADAGDQSTRSARRIRLPGRALHGLNQRISLRWTRG